MSYSSYKKGLRVGDYVKLDCNYHGLLFSNNSITCVVLSREFLFASETRFGRRTFWNYKALFENSIISFKTQNIRVRKVLSNSP